MVTTLFDLPLELHEIITKDLNLYEYLIYIDAFGIVDNFVLKQKFNNEYNRERTITVEYISNLDTTKLRFKFVINNIVIYDYIMYMGLDGILVIEDDGIYLSTKEFKICCSKVPLELNELTIDNVIDVSNITKDITQINTSEIRRLIDVSYNIKPIIIFKVDFNKTIFKLSLLCIVNIDNVDVIKYTLKFNYKYRYHLHPNGLNEEELYSNVLFKQNIVHNGVIYHIFRLDYFYICNNVDLLILISFINSQIKEIGFFKSKYKVQESIVTEI